MTVIRICLLFGGTTLIGWIVLAVLNRRRHPTPMSPLWIWTLKIPMRIFELRRVLAPLSGQGDMKLLEVGCGPGVVLDIAAAKLDQSSHLYGIDLQYSMLTRARDRMHRYGHCNSYLAQANATSLPFTEGSFDHVYMISVLGEIPEKATAVSEAMRVLKPKGMLSIIEHFMDPDHLSSSQVVGVCLSAGVRCERSDGSRWSRIL